VDMKAVESSPISIVSLLGNAIIPSSIGMYNYKSIYQGGRDVDLYQSQKALDNGKLALKEGGILIRVSECRSGIGEEAYFNLLASSKTPQEALQRIEQGYKLGYHKAAKMAEIATRAEIWGVTGLAEQDMEQAFIKPFHEVQEALDRAIEKKGEKAKILFLMDANLTVPKLMR